jgi:RNA polymerase sigma-70 factor (ECF subfamily)
MQHLIGEYYFSEKNVTFFPKSRTTKWKFPIDMDERAIISACQSGETERFAELYDLYADRIFRFIFHKTMQHDLAEDLTSDTFLRALEKIKQFDPEKGQFSTWIYTIARNLITDHWRSYREHQDIEDVWDLSSLDDVLDSAHKQLISEKLHMALRDLSPESREILMMRFWQDLSFAQIAEVTGKSEGAVKMAAGRALQKLRADAPTLASFIAISLLF